MKIIFLSKFCQRSGSRTFSLSKVAACLGVVVSVVTGGALWTGYQMGLQALVAEDKSDRANQAIMALIDDQKAAVIETRESTREHMDALALRLGAMQSHVMRIDALGERLATLGKLDADEFNFTESPARGGVETTEEAQSVEAAELVAEMEQLSSLLDDREHKLKLLEGLIVSSELQKELQPAGRPVKKGWISSRYGYRKDPFTGKKAFHRGVDIAGKKNSEIVAVASGVVIEAGKKSGYGYFVELRHADGYTTRYAHNSEIFVDVGEMVEKGQPIGAMGSSGRSTGPHVHFEIARNGKSLNPSKFLRKIN